jgi:hypothetical protein
MPRGAIRARDEFTAFPGPGGMHKTT